MSKNSRYVVNAISEKPDDFADPLHRTQPQSCRTRCIVFASTEDGIGKGQEGPFNHSCLASKDLKAKQKQLCLPSHCLTKEVVTCWNSALDMTYSSEWTIGCYYMLIFLGSTTWSLLLRNDIFSVNCLSHLWMQQRFLADSRQIYLQTFCSWANTGWLQQGWHSRSNEEWLKWAWGIITKT